MNHLERAFDNQNQWWKYFLMFFAATFGALIIGYIPAIIMFINGGGLNPNSSDDIVLSSYGINNNLELIFTLLPSIIAIVFIGLLLKPLHKRKLKEIINGTSKIRWNKVFFSLTVYCIICGLALLIDLYFSPENFVLNFNISSFIPLVIISLILIPIQSTSEEILYRGYIAQGVAVLTKNRWLAIIIPTLLFCLMHSFNSEVDIYGFWKIMPTYLIFGLVLGLITILDDGIESAMGVHAANNIFASIFITFKGSVLNSSALFEQTGGGTSLRDIFVGIFSYIVFIAILSYKYKWKYSILNKKIPPLPPQV